MMRPSDSNSQVRADHYSAMGNHGGGGGGGPDDMHKTHGNMGDQHYMAPSKLLTDASDDLNHHHADFMMTMSP